MKTCVPSAPKIRQGSDGEISAPLIVVQNWFEELRRLVPTN